MKRAIVLGLGLVLAGFSCRETGRPDPAVRMAPSHDVEQQAGTNTGEAGGQKVPQRIDIPPEVQSAYSGIRLSWKDANNGEQGLLDVPLGGTARIPGSAPPLELRGDVYLPAFTMTQDAITSSGVEEQNPAARYSASEGGTEIFAGWIFARFPDVHPFQHKRYSLKLVGGIRKAPAKK